MKKKLLTLTAIALFTATAVNAQFYANTIGTGLTITPAGATGNDEITITLDTKKVCKDGSAGIIGTVANMHSGVDTTNNGGWQKVVEWNGTGGNNKANDGTSTILTSLGNGVFSIKFTPKTYFGIKTAAITSMGFVFNAGSDGGWANIAKNCDSTGKSVDYYIEFPIPATATSINESKGIIGAVSAYPNPATQQMNISYSVLKSSVVSIKLYNLLGSEVAATTATSHAPGFYKESVDLSSVESGLYVYVLKVNGAISKTEKILITK